MNDEVEAYAAGHYPPIADAPGPKWGELASVSPYISPEDFRRARLRAQFRRMYPQIVTVYIPCRCCGNDILPFVAGSYPEHQLCDCCGRGKCDDCLNIVRNIWGRA